MASTRQFLEKQYQGEDEEIAYTVDTATYGGTPTAVAVKLYSFDGRAYTDVSTTCLSGAASVVSDTITTPTVEALTPNVMYRMEVKFTSGGNIYEPWGWIIGER